MNPFNSSVKEASQDQISLRGLLSIIDRETEPFLVRNVAEFYEQAQSSVGHKKLYITFLVAEIELALPIESIQEIDKLPAVSPLPGLPPWVRGISHVRGEIIAVFDLKTLFNLSMLSTKKAEYFILLRKKQRKFGFPVDRITGIIGSENGGKNTKFAEKDDGEKSNDLSSYIQGTLAVEDRVLAVLDGEKLLHSSMIQL